MLFYVSVDLLSSNAAKEYISGVSTFFGRGRALNFGILANISSSISAALLTL